jgi:hypothetical protein
MTTIRSAFALLFAAAVLCGCASYTGSALQPGVSTQADTRALMGAPAAVHKAPPGAGYTESWEYPHGPMGRHTFMARFDAAGKLVRVDQVLQAKTLAAIHYGTDTQADVRALLGRPGTITGPNRLYGGEIWGYAAYDGQRKIILSISFDAQGRAQAAGEAPDPEEVSPNDGATS